MSTTLLPMRLKDAPLQLVVSVEARTNILLLAKPAVGKTETELTTAIRIAAGRPSFQHVFCDMTSMTPVDFGATMPNRETGKLDYYPNGVLPNGYETPDWEGVIIMNELPGTEATTFKLSQKYVNRESINGKLIMPDKAVIWADGNRLVDKSGVNVQSRAGMSRFEQQFVYSEPQDNLDYMSEHDWHPRIQGYLKEHAHHIDNYEIAFGFEKPSGESNESRAMRESATEEGKMGVWANMRSWKRLNDIEFALDRMNKPLMPQRAFGNVGSAIGREYVTFRETLSKLASLDEILKNPTKVEVPENMGEIYATLIMLVQRTPITKVEAMAKYLERIPGDLMAMAIQRLKTRSLKNQDFPLRTTDVWKTWMMNPQYQALMTGKA